MSGEVFWRKGYFAETDVGLVTWRRVVYHVTHCKWVVICCIHQSLGLLLFLTQTIGELSPPCHISKYKDFSTGEVQMLRYSMIILPVFHINGFEIIIVSVYPSRHQPQKITHFNFPPKRRHDKIYSPPSSDVLDLTFSDDRLKPNIIPELSQKVTPERLVDGRVLFEVPDGKFIRIDKGSTLMTAMSVNNHLPPSAVPVKSMKMCEQLFNMHVIGILFLFIDGHIENFLPQLL